MDTEKLKYLEEKKSTPGPLDSNPWACSFRLLPKYSGGLGPIILILWAITGG